ncbi:MAG: hypothetical protein AB1768_12265 [Pseudomonadota bacterium]
MAPATVVRELGMLQQVITHAMREWEIVLPANPGEALVKRPKVANARSRRLQLADPGAGEEAKSEEERLLAACSYDPRSEGGCRVKWLRPIVELAIETAMRRGELLALDLRHEAASRLAEKLTNILELSSVTGHRDLRMLKRYYHPRPEELARRLASP